MREDKGTHMSEKKALGRSRTTVVLRGNPSADRAKCLLTIASAAKSQRSSKEEPFR